MDGFSPFLEGSGSSMLEDLFSYSARMPIDTFPELCSPSIADQVLSPFNYSVSWLKPGSETSLASPNSQAPSRDSAPGICNDSRNSGGVDYCFRDDSAPQISGLQAVFLLNSLQKDVSGRNGLQFNVSDADEGNTVVPKSVMGVSISERLLKALSLFKESSGGGILAQVWMPVNQGDEYILSTYEQPYLLDQILAGYREVSRAYTFSAKEAPGSITGLPGRVFVSGKPEWTSNIVYYHRQEYLRVEHARNYNVRGLLGVPIFDLNEHSCCGVLELVTVKEKSDFDSEMDSIYQALQAVSLRSVKVCAQKQGLKMGQKSAFAEILDVLRAVCHAHMLPLALTWVPLSNKDEGRDEYTRDAAEANSISHRKIMLRIQESACYVNDQQMQSFLHACSEHHLQSGQGIAGKAIQSIHPIFSPDVKSYDVHQYPLAHHARKFGLHAAVAIRLRSTYTGNDDYILEFFLPINCKGSAEQQLLLNNMSITLQRICRSLRTVSDTEVVRTDVTKEGPGTRQTIPISAEYSQNLHDDAELNLTKLSFELQNMEARIQGDVHPGQMKSGSPRHPKKKRSTVERNISLSVLQQYYPETLKEAAKNIGVCPTTLKKICRRNGILRWPSREIRKVSHSMKTVQNMIDSVQGVAGILKYDNATGKLFTEVSSPEKQAAIASEPSRPGLPDQCVERLEEATCLVGRNQIGNSGQPHHHHEANIACVPPFGTGDKCKVTSSGVLSNLGKEKFFHDASSKGGLSSESLKCSIRSKSSSSMAAVEEMHTKMDASERIMERSHPSYSSMTDSSSGSASSHATVKRSLQNNSLATEFGSVIHVKATYKEGTIRFKFSLSMGVHELIEVIGKRFKLCSGSFQLRYMDDEEEWVMLANEEDLQECVEVFQSMESQTLRLLVQDLPCATSSSTSSNCLLMKP